MFCVSIFLAALSLLAGTAAAINQIFTSSGEMDISSCPITYYGRKYDTVYVAFNASKFAVCFNSLYKPGIENDCILMSGGTADRGNLDTLTKEIPMGSGVHKLLPNLKNAGKCVNVIPLKDSQQSQIEQVELGNFGTQAILAIKTYTGYKNLNLEADAQVSGHTVSKQRFNTSQTNMGVITDVSGCRLSGFAYKTNTTVWDPRTCSTVTCDVSGVATAISDCSPMEHCNGNGSCVFNSICSVTGSTVIDVMGRVHSVGDRCGYTLMGPSVIPGFQVLGLFQERRRKDVSFLDHVILKLDNANVQISLEHGGRVRLNDQELKLNHTAQEVHGVRLTRDQTGVTAEISHSNYKVSVLFDGHTTQIHMTGPNGAPVQGLCGNSSQSVVQARVTGPWSPGCEVFYNDTADSTINCNTSTKWCNFLKQAPFTACNKHINPEPFITACKRTLCKYPPVDGLKCQFLEAYARACSRRNKVTMESWRTTTQCPAASPAFCNAKFCSAHEFCGESRDGKPRCLCRAIFASEYRSTNTFGEPTSCEQNSATVEMANCLLEEKYIDYTVLHLSDPTCKAQMDELTHMVKFNFSSNNCGTVIMANNSEIIYRNAIRTQNVSMFGLINRQDPVLIDFSCYYSQPDSKNFGIKIKHSSMIQQITSGAWSYNLTMNAYNSPDRITPIQPNTDIQLNERIWVELKTEGLDGDMIALVTDSCWATDKPSPNGSLRYDLIMKGCPNTADETVKMESNGLGMSNVFSFSTFTFSSGGSDVFLHCKLELCIKQSGACAPRCGQAVRRRRFAMPKYLDENSAFISIAWTV